MKKKYIIAILFILVFVVLISGTLMASHAYYYNSTAKLLLFNGYIHGDYDFKIKSIYVDGNEVDNMSSVPSNYIIDEENSFCYVSTPSTPDANVELYTNDYGEHIIDNYTKLDKCELYFRKSGPTSYWFDTSTCSFNNPCTHPNYGGTLQSTGTATGHNVYIGQDSSKYYVCATISGHEICLSQPYTQYGLSGHILNRTLTLEQQTSAKQAIYQAFIDAGITVDINDDCYASSNYAVCTSAGGANCEVSVEGYVRCNDNSDTEFCLVDSLGLANCVLT